MSSPNFYCAIDKQDLDTKDAVMCKGYTPVVVGDVIHCSTCEYFRDNWTPDTIISLQR